MNDNSEVPNPALRAHVSDHSFVLTLRRTHVLLLEAIVREYRLEFDERLAWRPRSETNRFWVPGVKALEGRGLLEVRHNPDFMGRKWNYSKAKLSDSYRLTRAGWAAYDLLAEAGLVPAVERRDYRRRFVA